MANKPSTTKSKKPATKKPAQTKQRFTVKPAYLFVLLFAVIGTIMLVRSFAQVPPSDPSDIAFAYYQSRPTVITNDPATGKVEYPSYTSSYILLSDGTLLCDNGNTTGDIKTGTLPAGRLKQLQNVTRSLDLTTVPKDTKPANTTVGISDNEGYVVNIDGDVHAFSVHKDSKKPDKLSKLQDSILNTCQQYAQSMGNRASARQFKIPQSRRSSAQSEDVLNQVASLLVPKVSAAPASTVADVDYAFADDQANRTNTLRQFFGLFAYTRRGCLNQAAWTQAKLMAEQQQIFHTADLVNSVLTNCGSDGANSATWTMAGENVGVTGGVGVSMNDASAALMSGYASSPGHFANLTNRTARCHGHGSYRHKVTGKWYHVMIIASWRGGICQL